MRPVRWGVLGTAKIARERVIPAMQEAANCAVTAIASRHLEKAETDAKRLNVPKAYGSYEGLLEDSTIEAVYIPLPNHLHAEWTIRAAEAGKHVLCEKPMAISVGQAEAMVAACRESAVLLMEAFMYRLHPQWVKIRELVSKGTLGDLKAIQCFLAYRQLDPNNIRNVVEYGGGALMDVGCYCINLSRMLFGGEPVRVEGIVRKDLDFGTDVLTSGLLEFRDGHAAFTCSTQLEGDQRVHLVGTKAKLSIEIPFNMPPDRPTQLILYSGNEQTSRPLTEVIEVPAANKYGIQADLFSRAVLEGRDVPIPPEDAVANLRVIEALLASV